jgi:hypothetical protein
MRRIFVKFGILISSSSSSSSSSID